MSPTLYYYILKDLVRLLVLSTVVLVTLISAGAAIHPLSEGVLGPGLVVKFVLYMMPTMLQFALPFAAAFASTVTFVRLAADNEVMACSASGMSYRTILLPVLFLGLVLMLGQFFLSNFVAPSFYKRAAQLIQNDLTSLVIAEIKSDDTARIGDAVIFANRVEEVEVGVTTNRERERERVSGDGPVLTRRLLMEGVAVGRIDENNRMSEEKTAGLADVAFYRIGDQLSMSVLLKQVMYYDEARGDFAFADRLEIQNVTMPTPWSDREQFMSWSELRKLGEEPDRYDKTRTAKRKLMTAIAAEEALRLVAESLRGGELRLISLAGDAYVLRAARAERSPNMNEREVSIGLGRGEAMVPGEVAIEVETRSGTSGGGVVRQIEAVRGRISVETTEETAEPRIVVELEEVAMRDMRGEERFAERENLELPVMRWPRPIAEAFAGWNANLMLKQARVEDFVHVPAIAVAAGHLNGTISRLYREVISQLNQRASISIVCFLVFVLGAVLSMRMRGRMTLVVYLWVFLLAIFAVLIGRSGHNMIVFNTSIYVGIMVTWGGAAILFVTCMANYGMLRRH